MFAVDLFGDGSVWWGDASVDCGGCWLFALSVVVAVGVM